MFPVYQSLHSSGTTSGLLRVKQLAAVALLMFCLSPNALWAQAEPVLAQDTLYQETDAPEDEATIEDMPETAGNYDEPYTPPPVRPVAMREVEKEKWDDAANGLDYSKDQPKPEKTRQNRNFDMSGWNATTAGIGKIMQILAIMVALAAIAFGIYRTLQAPKNRKIGQAEDGTIITAENVDAYIHETDLERFLREALASGNYALCIRLYYLQTIKTLSEKDAIKWSREKTNRDYLREMRDHRLGREFREATRTFERVWYGNEPLDAGGYALLEPGFKGLLTQL
jgi:hypothetical protein